MPFVFMLVYLVLVLIRPQEYPSWPLQAVPMLPLALACALLAWGLSRHKRFDAPQYPLLVLFLLLMIAEMGVSRYVG